MDTDKKSDINKVLQLYEKLTYHIENEEHSEEKLLREELNSNETLAGIPLSLTESHVIACIGDHGQINGTFIAKKLNITKGGISKAVSKLIQKDMIAIIKSPSNKKEIYYDLSPLGKEVYEAHAHMHEKAQDQLKFLLNTYSADELKAISKFLGDFIHTLGN